MKIIFKRILLTLALAGFTVLLTGCSFNQGKTTTATSAPNTTISVQVTVGKQTTNYTVKQGSTLLALSENKLHANVTKGLINSIDHLASDPKTDSYLMFKVNGKVSQVGASEVKLKNGDKIEFYLSKF